MELLRILLIEDNPGDARLLRELLSDAGASAFALVHVTRLRDGLEQLREDRFDVVLLDLSLPDSHGLDTLRAVHAHSPQYPVVVLTGYDDEAQAVRAVQSGAQDYLIKGKVDSNLLVRSMRYACERHRMVAQVEEARRQEHYFATHDILTSLPNRQLFRDRLARALADSRRHEAHVALLFLDLDRFKYVNDTLGHSVGDQLLQAVSRRLTACIRETDTAARLGGDEFTIVLTNIYRTDDVARIANKILTAMKEPFEVDGRQLFTTTSIGVSLYPTDGDDAETLIRHADIAMYRAKSSGRNNFQFYRPVMNEWTLERIELERNLRRALDRNELMLLYQPQFDVSTNRITGVEALIRWNHPSQGVLSPSHFIELAEETGLIVPIGEWTLRTACQQNCRWMALGLPPITMAVNLSLRQFQQEDPAGLVARVLRETGHPPDLLELEISETSLMRDVEASEATLKRLRDLGVRVSVDDFGTGYSSLGHLKRFALEKIKIDRLFVNALNDTSADRDVVAAIVAMAHRLRIKPMAEGVETPGQLAELRALDCCDAQGYLLGMPLASDEATALLQTQVGALTDVSSALAIE